MRILLLAIVALSLILQSLAIAGHAGARLAAVPATGGSVAAAGVATDAVATDALADDLEHSMLHWEGIEHHHDETGHWYIDTSDDSRQHVTLDGGLAAPAICPTLPVIQSLACARTLPRHVEIAALVHDGDGLRRPPRRLI